MFFTFPSGLFGAAPFLKNSKTPLQTAVQTLLSVPFPNCTFFLNLGHTV